MSGLRLVRDLWADAFEHLGLPRPVEVAPADVLGSAVVMISAIPRLRQT